MSIITFIQNHYPNIIRGKKNQKLSLYLLINVFNNDEPQNKEKMDEYPINTSH